MKKLSFATLLILFTLALSTEAEAQICNPKNCDFDLCKLICSDNATATTVKNDKKCCPIPNCCLPKTSTTKATTEAPAKTVAFKVVIEEKSSCCTLPTDCCVSAKGESL